MPAGVHNGSSIFEPERSLVVTALAQGESVASIARRTGHACDTIAAVRDTEWEEVLRRKPILAAQAERNALLAGEQIQEALEQRKFPVNSLPVVYGVSIDKVLALRDPLSGSQQHLHLHLQPNDVAGKFNAMLAALTEKARLLPPHHSTPDIIAQDHSALNATVTSAPSDSTPSQPSQECEASHAPSKNARASNVLEVSTS